MRLLALSPPHARAGEIGAAVALLSAGFERYHLRKPGLAAQELSAFAREFPAELRPRISLHGDPALAAAMGLGGAHGQGSSPEGLLRSVSLHALDEVATGWDYALLSPVFDSLSKPGLCSAFTRESLREFLGNNNDRAPIYALGGIAPERLGECRALGFNGAAALGFLWGGGDPLENGRALLHAAARSGNPADG